MKQTPEQAALEALQIYSDYMGYSPKQYDARQTIIKAFQDRERLLSACEFLVASCDSAPPIELIKYIAESCEKARTAIAKAKS